MRGGGVQFAYDTGKGLRVGYDVKNGFFFTIAKTMTSKKKQKGGRKQKGGLISFRKFTRLALRAKGHSKRDARRIQKREFKKAGLKRNFGEARYKKRRWG